MSVCESTKLGADCAYRTLVVAAGASVASLIPVAAHQIGLLDHLPDPPGALFDSDQITQSKTAHPLEIPDGFLGLASYGTTLTLALLARNRPGMRRLLAIKLIADGSLAGFADGSLAGFNVARQVVSFRKLCSWCTGTAVCTAVMLFAGRKLIAEEAAAAAKRWQ